MTGKRVLMVEGPDDEHVVKNLCGARNLGKIDHVHPYGGKDPLIEERPADRRHSRPPQGKRPRCARYPARCRHRPSSPLASRGSPSATSGLWPSSGCPDTRWLGHRSTGKHLAPSRRHLADARQSDTRHPRRLSEFSCASGRPTVCPRRTISR